MNEKDVKEMFQYMNDDINEENNKVLNFNLVILFDSFLNKS